MEQKTLNRIIEELIDQVSELIHSYMKIDVDRNKSEGNVSICMIDEDGNVYGKMFGIDKIKRRETYNTAWMKASQVWITGLKTGEFERLVFNGEIDEKQFGIRRPDYIGWEGGQLITLDDGAKLAVGFSGFRGVTDLEIVNKAFNNISIKNY